MIFGVLLLAYCTMSELLIRHHVAEWINRHLLEVENDFCASRFRLRDRVLYKKFVRCTVGLEQALRQQCACRKAAIDVFETKLFQYHSDVPAYAPRPPKERAGRTRKKQERARRTAEIYITKHISLVLH